MTKKIERLAEEIFSKESGVPANIARTIRKFKKTQNMPGMGHVRAFLTKCAAIKGTDPAWQSAPRVIPVSAPVTGKSRQGTNELAGGGLTYTHTVQLLPPTSSGITQNVEHQMTLSDMKESWLPAWVYALDKSEARFKKLFPVIQSASKKKQEETVVQRLLRTKEALPKEQREKLDEFLEKHGADSLAELLGFGELLRKGNTQGIIDKATRGNLLNKSLNLLTDYQSAFSHAPEAYSAAQIMLNSGTTPELEEVILLAEFALEQIPFDTKVLLRKEKADIAFAKAHGLGSYSLEEPDLNAVVQPTYVFPGLVSEPKKISDVLTSKKTTRRIAQAARDALSKQQYFNARNNYAQSLVAVYFTPEELEQSAQILWKQYATEREQRHQHHENTGRRKIPELPKSPAYQLLESVFETSRYAQWTEQNTRKNIQKERLIERMIRTCSLDELMSWLPRMKTHARTTQWNAEKNLFSQALQDHEFLPLVDHEQAKKVYTEEELAELPDKKWLKEFIITAKECAQLRDNRGTLLCKSRAFAETTLPLLEESLQHDIIPADYTKGDGKRLLTEISEVISALVPSEAVTEKYDYLVQVWPLVITSGGSSETKILIQEKKLPKRIHAVIAQEIKEGYTLVKEAVGIFSDDAIANLVQLQQANRKKVQHRKHYSMKADTRTWSIQRGHPYFHEPQTVQSKSWELSNPKYAKQEQKMLTEYTSVHECSRKGITLETVCNTLLLPSAERFLRKKRIHISSDSYTCVRTFIKKDPEDFVHDKLVEELYKLWNLLEQEAGIVAQKKQELKKKGIDIAGVVKTLTATQNQVYQKLDGTLAWMRYIPELPSAHDAKTALSNPYELPPEGYIKALAAQAKETTGTPLEPTRNYEVFPVLGNDQRRIMAGVANCLNWGAKHGYRYDGKVWQANVTPDKIRSHAAELSKLARRPIQFRVYRGV